MHIFYELVVLHVATVLRLIASQMSTQELIECFLVDLLLDKTRTLATALDMVSDSDSQSRYDEGKNHIDGKDICSTSCTKYNDLNSTVSYTKIDHQYLKSNWRGRKKMENMPPEKHGRSTL
ncbi:hypothetical protein EV424DRAFT_277219 [Suillus variegatus]|nr:hypothetical protein EV424DRAFT_277219 [Suillus variegatus]